MPIPDSVIEIERLQVRHFEMRAKAFRLFSPNRRNVFDELAMVAKLKIRLLTELEEVTIPQLDQIKKNIAEQLAAEGFEVSEFTT